MPPRNRSTAPATDYEAEEEPTGAPVTRLSTVDLDLDTVAEDEPEGDPFTFTLGGRDWSVPPPGVGQTLDAEQAPFLSDFFEIIMGEELWEEFLPVFRSQTQPSLTWKLARGMSVKFGMDPNSVQDAVEKDDRAHGNRASRRARGPRRR